jgi:cell division protease FtsH
MKLLALLLAFFAFVSVAQAEEVSYSSAVDLIKDGQVKEAYFQTETQASLIKKDDQSFEVYFPDKVQFSNLLEKENVEVWFSPKKAEEKKEPVKTPVWLSILPGINQIYPTVHGVVTSRTFFNLFVLFLFLSVIGYVLYKRRSLNKVSDKPILPASDTKFEDIAGLEEVVEEVEECVQFLQDPTPFQKLGAEMPSGIILYGRPGTGKTLLARAVAGEAGVSFMQVSGSSFAEKYVGVGARKVRDLFDKARKAPSGAVIFIDELDALAKTRSDQDQGAASDERDATLNELLVQMDGFKQNERILIIGATNRLDRLDPAVLRPGRFARQIEVPLPNKEGRLEILKMYADNKPLSSDVDINHLADITSGSSGADLKDIVNEGAILAARNNQQTISQKDLEDAQLKKMAGLEKKKYTYSQKEKETIAYHEAGHILASELCPDHPVIERATIKPRNSGAGGMAVYGQKDQALHWGDDIHQRLIVLLAGRAAEEIQFRRVSSGASSDLEQATRLARQAIERLGFSKNQSTSAPDIQMSNQSYLEIDRQVEKSVDDAYQAALRLMKEHQKDLQIIANLLLEKEEIKREDIIERAGDIRKKQSKTRRRLNHSFRPTFKRRPVKELVNRFSLKRKKNRAF